MYRFLIISLLMSFGISAQEDTVVTRIDVKRILTLSIHESITYQSVSNLHFDNEYYEVDLFRDLRTHTFLKPRVTMLKETKTKNNYIQKVLPLMDVHTFTDDAKNFGYRAGAGVSYNAFLNHRFQIKLNAVQGVYDGDSLYNPRSYLNWKEGSTKLYTDIRSRISYTPNHIFNFQAGVDHNFYGEGSRSLFLSDYGNPYPFGLIRARFWRAEYSILYQFMREGGQSIWKGKFASSHHISFNAAKWLNIGIFETVIFNPNDTLLHRGFDVEYLNPIVFYRPQEYSVGSSDNVLLGIDLTARIKKWTLYSQFILDEFYLAEIRARSQWWANKYGGQFGVKGTIPTSKGKLYMRSEFNFVRPYTYAHLNEYLNYGNQGLPLAHPYGANFAEMLLESMLFTNRWAFRSFLSYSLRGGGNDTYNFGGDIYRPYSNRPYEYGHFIGQGEQLNQWLLRFIAEYRLPKIGKMYLHNSAIFAECNLRYTVQERNTNLLVLVGLRRKLWNDYRNF